MKRRIGSVIFFSATKSCRCLTTDMTEPEIQISRLISEPISVDRHVEKLDDIRLKGYLQPDERRQLLPSFFAMHKESHEKTPVNSINAQTRTGKLCERYCSRLVTNWIEVSRSSLNNTTTLSLLVNQKPKTDCDTVHFTIVPSNDVFQETRDFVRITNVAQACDV